MCYLGKSCESMIPAMTRKRLCVVAVVGTSNESSKNHTKENHMGISTNNVPRELIGWTALSKREKGRFQSEFDKHYPVRFFRYKDKLHYFNRYVKTSQLNYEGFIELYLSDWTHADVETKMCIKLLGDKRIVVGHY